MRFLSVSVLVVSLSLAACGGGAASNAPSEAPAAGATVKKPGEAAMGDKTTCPISKEVFTVSASSPKAEYKGKTYYFCCGGCDEKFKSNPEKYLEPAPAP